MMKILLGWVALGASLTPAAARGVKLQIWHIFCYYKYDPDIEY